VCVWSIDNPLALSVAVGVPIGGRERIDELLMEMGMVRAPGPGLPMPRSQAEYEQMLAMADGTRMSGARSSRRAPASHRHGGGSDGRGLRESGRRERSAAGMGGREPMDGRTHPRDRMLGSGMGGGGPSRMGMGGRPGSMGMSRGSRRMGMGGVGMSSGMDPRMGRHPMMDDVDDFDDDYSDDDSSSDDSLDDDLPPGLARRMLGLMR
jgi:hypothetical protein